MLQFSLTQDPIGLKILKRHSSFKLLLYYSTLLLKFLLSGPHKSSVLNFEFLIFNGGLKFSIVLYGETKNFHCLENERP